MDETTQNTQVMDEAEAVKFIHRYVCSTCWSDLVADRIEGQRYDRSVHCGNENCSGAGFVTRKYVEKRRDDDHFDYLDAKRNLGEVLGLPNPNKGKTAEQLLAELGF